MHTTYDVRHQLDGTEAFLKFSETSEALVVDVVFVPAAHRKKRVGRLLMTRVLLLADAVRKPVRLVARPLGASSPQSLHELIGFYQALGFEVVSRSAGAADMCRPAAGSGGSEG